MLYRLILVMSLFALRQIAPTSNAVVAIVIPGEPVSAYGVYLGHGLVLTNWHPWTLDGAYVAADDSPLSPSQQAPGYDDDGSADPGERILTLADCSGTWTQAGPACTPFARWDGAGFAPPNDSAPVPITRLLYASRRADIALFEVDAQAIEARGIRPARLSMIPTQLAHPVTVIAQAPLDTTLKTGTPVTQPQDESPRFTGPWRVPSLELTTSDPMPEGSPVFDRDTGDLVGLVWRGAWVTPAALWFHDLYAANDDLHSAALAAVLEEASTAPVDGTPTLDDPLTAGLGNSGIDVQHVDLALALDPEAGRVSGTATLDIRARMHDLYTFSLDAAGLDIAQITINGADAPFAAKAQKVFIQLPEPLAYGTIFQVAITYTAAAGPVQTPYMPYFEIGLFSQSGILFTLNEPDGAHTWFPCNDHPTDRATYDFHLTVKPPLEAVANGLLIATDTNPDGTSTYHWQMDAPMATYLVTVVAGDYVAIQDQTPDGIAIQNFVYPADVDTGRAVFAYTAEAITMLEALFGPYPYASYGHIVVPGNTMALETQSLTTMPDSLLTTSEQDIYALLVHELAHQWFGNTVSLATWADIWLNEGFTTYAEWLGLEQRYGPEAAVAARGYSEQALITDTRITPLVSPAPAEMFGIGSYDKGAWVLHMLRQRIGDEAFFTLLRTYADTFRARPANSVDFWRLAEEVSGQDLTGFFTQWLLQDGGIPRYVLYWSGADVLLCAAGAPYDLDLPLRFSGEGKTWDTTLATTQAQARFSPGFAPVDVTVDPDQQVLAQVEVQAIASLPDTCPG